MVVVSSTTNEWSQYPMDEKSSLMASTSRLVMEKVQPTQEPQLYQQQPNQNGLKCPRCESSNTKFCYYNNYSLSQPRHFCKACKRYWTRGGSLRNVPVGGGCRKNKRSKRSSSSLEGPNPITSTSNTTNTNIPSSGENPSYNNINPTSQTKREALSSTSNHINPLLFGVPTNPSELNLPFLGRCNPSSRVSSISVEGCDLQPQFNALGLGISSGLIMSSVTSSGAADNGFINPSKQINDVVLPSYNTSIFGSSSLPTMATLLASNFHQQKFSAKDTNKIPLDHFHSLATTSALEGLQMNGINGEAGNIFKGVKTEPGQNRLEWNLPYQNQMEPNGFSDPNTLGWNNTSGAVGAWNDQANIGPSVTSLI